MYVRIHVVGGMSVETVDGWTGETLAAKIANKENRPTVEVRNRKTNRLVLVPLDKVAMVEEFDE